MTADYNWASSCALHKLPVNKLWAKSDADIASLVKLCINIIVSKVHWPLDWMLCPDLWAVCSFAW